MVELSLNSVPVSLSTLPVKTLEQMPVQSLDISKSPCDSCPAKCGLTGCRLPGDALDVVEAPDNTYPERRDILEAVVKGVVSGNPDVDVYYYMPEQIHMSDQKRNILFRVVCAGLGIAARMAEDKCPVLTIAIQNNKPA